MTDSPLLSTGEFARMCCVSRELLVHYDKIGLLKPKKVEGNGYRYYSLRQLYLFDVIRFFIDTGMSTKEVRDYLENRSTDLFLDTIQESIDALGRQRDLLTARIGMMEKMRYLTQRAASFPKGKAKLAFWDET
ncbi:MAG TPA: MerR family transcriptional regulator [Candidatus Aphodovivens avistercoris]|nr:MerR family transcriptional regulator [Candidatus Aphodovivens avistercoris]